MYVKPRTHIPPLPRPLARIDQILENLCLLCQKPDPRTARDRSWIADDTWRVIDRRAQLDRRHIFGHTSSDSDIPDCDEVCTNQYRELGKVLCRLLCRDCRNRAARGATWNNFWWETMFMKHSNAFEVGTRNALVKTFFANHYRVIWMIFVLRLQIFTRLNPFLAPRCLLMSHPFQYQMTFLMKTRSLVLYITCATIDSLDLQALLLRIFFIGKIQCLKHGN